MGGIPPTLMFACHLALPPAWAYDSPPMNEPATQPDTTLATDWSPAVAVWQRFFLFTADNERVLT